MKKGKVVRFEGIKLPNSKVMKEVERNTHIWAKLNWIRSKRMKLKKKQ